MVEETALVGNAADEAQVKKAAKEEKTSKKTEKQEMIQLLETRGGREVLWRLLIRCHVFETSYTRADGIVLAFNEGQRDIGLKILSDINEAGEEYFLQMMQEHKKK